MRVERCDDDTRKSGVMDEKESILAAITVLVPVQRRLHLLLIIQVPGTLSTS